MTRRHNGGKAPRKFPLETIIEAAPSHDGTPTTAGYWLLEPMQRPLYAHRIYDTTPDAAIPGRAAELAKTINERTWDYRMRSGCGQYDRIEIVALPMPENTTAEERVSKCKAHHIAEMSNREADWHLPRTFRDNDYQRAIIIIGRLQEECWQAFDRPFKLSGTLQSKTYVDWEWEDIHNPFQNRNSSDWASNPYGTYLLAEWGLEISSEFKADLEEDGATMSEDKFSPHALVHLDQDLASLRDRIQDYCVEYAGQGLIDEELSLRASGGDWERVKLMNAR